MSAIRFTDEQRRAVETIDRSVIVTAAAGSGKTAVLAERCAYLVCDAPGDARCDVDALLVVTFTEAAAAQMRARIVEAIGQRVADRPDDKRLRRQMALVDSARISTIHAFCLWLVRRHFSELRLDAGAEVLDADEARLLKKETLQRVFADLYEGAGSAEHPLGHVDDDAACDKTATVETPTEEACDLPAAFQALVDDYGLGEDGGIAKLVEGLHDFCESLTDPDDWLSEAARSLGRHPETIVSEMIGELLDELPRQIEHCDRVIATLQAGHPAGHVFIDAIGDYRGVIEDWAARLIGNERAPFPETGRGDASAGEKPRGLKPAARDEETGDAPGECPEPMDAGDAEVVSDRLARFAEIQPDIAAFSFPRSGAPRLAKDADDAERAARDRAKQQLDDIRKTLYQKRLRDRYGAFSVEACIDDLRATAPFVATIVALVGALRRDYARRKRAMNVLDFSDQERLAFELLVGEASGVAPALHRRFRYVMVDEFQDVSPLQDAILRLASREASQDPNLPDNLFVVGDVKQSIYRFRLAEPAVFNERLRRFRPSASPGAAIALQHNFRSRGEILEAVNMLFRVLMSRACGPIVYDQEAELRAGREVDPGVPHAPVEVHVLDRKGSAHAEPEVGIDDAEPDRRHVPPSVIEREAQLIGTRIRELIGAGGPEPGDDEGRLEFGDIAVLVRSAKIDAERIASVLGTMEIPAYAEVGGSLFAAREVRDVLTALEVLDNCQQDIPLAAVLRSGVFGGPLSADDLVDIRCLDRALPFYAVVVEYAKRGPDTDPRRTLRAILDRIERFRTMASRRPLAEVVWRLYEETGLPASVCAERRGGQRYANLLKLHEIAQQFGTFRRQGLHRFLRFVQTLETEDRPIPAAPAVAEEPNVVRIMSIHKSKGLEFPVVFVAGLGTKFNFSDRSGRMIFERKSGIGLRVIDRSHMIEYPSVAHRRVVSEIERTTREEEMRVLYVAMTRAKDRLVLIGSVDKVEERLREATGSTGPPTPLMITTAATPMEWLLPVLGAAPPGVVRQADEEKNARPLFELHAHTGDELAAWTVAEPAAPSEQAVREAVANVAPLPPDEPIALNDREVEAVVSRLEFVYPALAATSVRASASVGELKHTYDFLQNPEERGLARTEDGRYAPTRKAAPRDRDEAALRGVVTHRALQHFDFRAATDPAGVASELQRMVTAGLLGEGDSGRIDAASLEWFVSTPLAEAIRLAGDAYRREFMYIALEPIATFDPHVDAIPEDRVLVRGIIDGVLPASDGLEIIDFKTDAIGPEAATDRAKRYRSQLELYAGAAARLWRRPARTCRLVFLSARRIVTWQVGAVSQISEGCSDEP